jgi:DNA-binding transcriptional ArsR family regulator
MKKEFYQKVKAAHKKLRTLENKRMLRVIEYLTANPGKNVTELFIKFRTDQSTMSQALSKLRSLNLLYAEKEGKEVRYYVNLNEVQKIQSSISKFNEHVYSKKSITRP